jgi:GTP-binding protein
LVAAVTTGELNRWFERAVEQNPPPAPRQVNQAQIYHPGEEPPPSFVVFGTRADQLPTSYQRYL